MRTEQRRERVIRLVKLRLLRRGHPRLLVTLILMMTGLAGFLVSYALLHSGMTRMWLRYPLAILFAYCVFLLLLRLWLALRRPRRGVVGDVLQEAGPDLLDAGESLLRSRGGGYAEGFRFSGAGGDAGGAGAGGSWGEASLSSSSSSGSSGGGGGFD